VRRARIERTGQPVYANEIDRQPPWRGEDLVCWERDCAADVREVVGYTKRDGTPYPAYFRLKKNVEHGAGCPLNPVEVITSIAQGSEGLATVDEGVLRLTLPQDISQPGPQSPGLGVGLAGGEVVDRRITTVPPLLPPLINSAVKIVRFLAAHDFDGTVVNRFKVLPYGAKRPVLWEVLLRAHLHLLFRPVHARPHRQAADPPGRGVRDGAARSQGPESTAVRGDRHRRPHGADALRSGAALRAFVPDRPADRRYPRPGCWGLGRVGRRPSSAATALCRGALADRLLGERQRHRRRERAVVPAGRSRPACHGEAQTALRVRRANRALFQGSCPPPGFPVGSAQSGAADAPAPGTS